MSGDQDGDVLELGGSRRRLLPWRPAGRWLAALLAVAALIVGLVAGYLGGDQHGRAAAAAAGPAASATASAAVGGYTLGQSGNQCSLQLGSSLQLGVQVTNGSSVPLTVGDIRTILPMGGLTVTAQRWGPCGELATSSDQADRYLPPGASTWFTVTVTVGARCPGPLPVQFMVGYDQNGKLEAVQLGGFADLGQVPYRSCPVR